MVLYMFISFSWWTILLLEKNNDSLALELNVLQLQNAMQPVPEIKLIATAEYKTIEKGYAKQRKMILSEAIVMMILLMAGTFQLYRTLTKEMELNRRQKNFLLSITHELKSPLSSTKLSLQTLMKRNKLDDENYFKLLTNSLDDIDRLKILVDNLLLSARIEDHSYQPSIELCNFSAMTEEIFNKSKMVYASRKIMTQSIIPDLYVYADTLALQTIINNLIDNAIKYTPEKALIHCQLYEKSGDLMLAIADNGFGISDTEKQKIFSKFYRVGNEDTRSTTGTGLGLYMVKELLKLLNGKVEVKNNLPAGTVFEITLPKAQTS